NEDAHRRIALDAVVDALQPPVEPAFLLRIEFDKTPDRVRAEVHTVGPGQGVARAHVCPRAHDQALGRRVLLGHRGEIACRGAGPPVNPARAGTTPRTCAGPWRHLRDSCARRY